MPKPDSETDYTLIPTDFSQVDIFNHFAVQWRYELLPSSDQLHSAEPAAFSHYVNWQTSEFTRRSPGHESAQRCGYEPRARA